MAKRVGVDKWIFFTTLLLVVVGAGDGLLRLRRRGAGAVSLALRLRDAAGGGRSPASWPWSCSSRIDYARYNSPRFIYPALAITTLLLSWCCSFTTRTIPIAGSASALLPFSRLKSPSR